MRYHTAEFERYILPARAKPQLWRLVAGLILFGLIYVGFIGGLVKFLQLFQPGGFTDDQIDMNTRPSMIVGLLTFVGGILGVWAAVRLLHERGFRTLLGPKTTTKPTLLRNFAIAAAIVFLGQCILIATSWLIYGVIPNQPLSLVVLFLPIGAVLLLIQTGAEEFLFRGYLMQQLGARFASPLIWLVLPSVVFGVIHYDPENMGDATGWVILAITVSALAWADLTRITGNIGAAWGWHFMNNMMVLNFVTIRGSMEGFSWKLTSFGPDDLTIWQFVPDIALSIGLWLILRRVLRPSEHI